MRNYSLTLKDDLGRIPTWVPPARVLMAPSGWTVTSHYFASYAKRLVPLPPPVDGAHDKDPGNLVVVVNRYFPCTKDSESQPHSNKEKLTLILAHSMGMHKESWEPTITAIFRLFASVGTRGVVAEIWAFEPVHHGDAALINKHANPRVDALNYPVDLIEFIQRRLPLDMNVATYSAHLPRHDVVRRQNVIGIGHSIGGTAIVQVALHASAAFASIILIEPLLSTPTGNVYRPFEIIHDVAAKRKDTFSSRDELAAYFQKHPAYKTWDPQIVDLFAQHAVYPTNDGKLMLKTRREHEAILSSDRGSYQAAWFSCPALPPVLPVLFIYGNRSLLLPAWSRKGTATLPPNGRTVTLDTGHMVVQEQPQTLGEPSPLLDPEASR